MTYDRLLMIDDIGKRFTAKANATISGGFLVKWASGTDSVGSDLSTYAWDDITVDVCDSVDNCVGVAMDTRTSGLLISIATDGIFILPAGSAVISGGFPVMSSGYANMVQGIAMNRAVGSGIQNTSIGRALTSATALTGYAVVKLSV